MTSPTSSFRREPKWGAEERSNFNQLVFRAFDPLPEFIDRDASMSSIELYKARLKIIQEAVSDLNQSYDPKFTSNLNFIHLIVAAESVLEVVPELEKYPFFAEDREIDLVLELGVKARRISASSPWLTEEQKQAVATVAVACNRFAALNATQQLTFLTENIFLDSGIITSQKERREEILNSYEQWTQRLDQLMVSLASSREYSKDSASRTQALDEVIANLEKLRVFQREKTAEILATYFPGGDLEANIFLVLKDMEKINTRAENNPGATMDIKSLRRMQDDFERNCTRTSVSTVHRLGGANVRAGAVASDGSTNDSKIYALEKFEKIYGVAAVRSWYTGDGTRNKFEDCQEVLRSLVAQHDQTGTKTALVYWQYKGKDYGHVTVATVMGRQAVIAESQDVSIIAVGDQGQLVRYEIDKQDPSSLKKTDPFPLEIKDIAIVPIPGTPTLSGKPCSHRAKCEQASEIMAQSWTNPFGPSPAAQSASR